MSMLWANEAATQELEIFAVMLLRSLPTASGLAVRDHWPLTQLHLAVAMTMSSKPIATIKTTAIDVPLHMYHQ